MDEEKHVICIWPNDVWCHEDFLNEYLTWQSDDYTREEVPLTWDEDKVDMFVANYNQIVPSN